MAFDKWRGSVYEYASCFSEIAVLDAVILVLVLLMILPSVVGCWIIGWSKSITAIQQRLLTLLLAIPLVGILAMTRIVSGWWAGVILVGVVGFAVGERGLLEKALALVFRAPPKS